MYASNVMDYMKILHNYKDMCGDIWLKWNTNGRMSQILYSNQPAEQTFVSQKAERDDLEL